MSHAFVEVQNATKRFPGPTKHAPPLVVFENVSFQLQKGEFVCIIGHSGCGKSTIMNALAGLDQFSDGSMVMENKEIDGPGLERGVVFQNYSLMPWLTALENVRFAVRARWKTWSEREVTAHSMTYLEMVGLKDVVDRKPSQLSGGMRQRVSIARAFATKPKMLLLDEPFGALDALTRGVIQDELVKIWSQDKQTVFMITHDVDEAIILADRIFLMTNGPQARIAEAVEIDLPRPRNRGEIVKHPNFYTIRNYLVDFLVNRSGKMLPLEGEQTGLHYPPAINPVTLDSNETPPLSAASDTEAATEKNDNLVTFTSKENRHG